MTEPHSPSAAADARHWRRSRRVALVLGSLWLAVWLAPLLFARQLDVDLFGAPLVFWICAQLAPVAFVLLVWRYERGMEQLDAQHRAGHVD